MIPTAVETKLEVDQRRLIFTAAAGTPDPATTRAILFGLLSAVEEEIRRAVANPEFIGTSVQVGVDPAILAIPSVVRVRNLLTALGYTVTLSGNTATIGW
jgi:hypothetical protein